MCSCTVTTKDSRREIGMTDEEMPALKRRRHGEEIMKTPTKIRDLELASAEYIEPYLKQV